MDKREFMEKLQRALAGGLNSIQVADNMRYYQDYIETEIRKGRSESDVLTQLGDPRLLAKSIIEANKRGGESYGSNREYDEEVADNPASEKKVRNFSYALRLPFWLAMLIVTVMVIIVIGIVTSLLSIFLPVLIVALVGILIVKLIQNTFNVIK
ncbi:MAG: DUF1700 domain-containing protein [Lachnospiraceae bacterium]|nr:DUF1700 domain-containing protein [Lachnospiraceae bacterium]